MPRPRIIAAAALVILAGGASRAAQPLPVAPLVARAEQAGLRILEGMHLVLITDRPERTDDGVTDLPPIFDAAVASWCRHFAIPPETVADWRACGCLVVDRERFRAAGLLPDEIPAFANGFCDRNRFWLVDQSNPAYRRHLLLHEGVHAFTITMRDALAPAWYMEGIAELLATHRLDDGRFTATPIPATPGAVEQLGRIEAIGRRRAAGTLPTLAEVFALPPATHEDVSGYAACWAAVALFSNHPAYAGAFAAAERGPLDLRFTERLTAGWDPVRTSRDFTAFLGDLDYGAEPARLAIDWRAGPPLRAARTCRVEGTAGWQNLGARVAAGTAVACSAKGRIVVGAAEAGPLESAPEGISIAWYRGRPVGRLLLGQWVEPPDASARFEILAEGADGTFTAAVTGSLFGRVNDAPGSLPDNAGAYEVTLRPAPHP